MDSVRRPSAAVLVALVALGFWYAVWDARTADKEAVRNSQTTHGKDKGARVWYILVALAHVKARMHMQHRQ